MTLFWQNWLRVASLILVAYGVMMALVMLPPMQDAPPEMRPRPYWPAFIFISNNLTVLPFLLKK